MRFRGEPGSRPLALLRVDTHRVGGGMRSQRLAAGGMRPCAFLLLAACLSAVCTGAGTPLVCHRPMRPCALPGRIVRTVHGQRTGSVWGIASLSAPYHATGLATDSKHGATRRCLGLGPFKGFKLSVPPLLWHVKGEEEQQDGSDGSLNHPSVPSVPALKPKERRNKMLQCLQQWHYRPV